MAKLYANGHDLKDPLLSPVYGDMHGFPPAILTTGTRDLLLSNTVRVHRKLRQAGVEAELEVYEGQSHAQYMRDGNAPETKEAFRKSPASSTSTSGSRPACSRRHEGLYFGAHRGRSGGRFHVAGRVAPRDRYARGWPDLRRRGRRPGFAEIDAQGAIAASTSTFAALSPPPSSARPTRSNSSRPCRRRFCTQRRDRRRCPQADVGVAARSAARPALRSDHVLRRPGLPGFEDAARPEPRQLASREICVAGGTVFELNLNAYFTAQSLTSRRPSSSPRASSTTLRRS